MFSVLIVLGISATKVKAYSEPAYGENEQISIKTKNIDIGEFNISFYDADEACTGSNKGITASGSHVKLNQTIAVDPKVIPLGTKVFIQGLGERIAEDTGGAIKGKKIDVYVQTHQEAIEDGRIRRKVYIVKEDK